MDQMVAFSRVFALMTGRAFVRATNSGVSLVLGPDGRELGRVQDSSGVDRAVAGFGAWTVPVPAPGTRAHTPTSPGSRLSEALWLGSSPRAGGARRRAAAVTEPAARRVRRRPTHAAPGRRLAGRRRLTAFGGAHTVLAPAPESGSSPHAGPSNDRSLPTLHSSSIS